jgi:hypothetical protein
MNAPTPGLLEGRGVPVDDVFNRLGESTNPTIQRQFGRLQEIVHPMSETEFKGYYLRKAFCRISGERSRFCSLLPWAVLNRILREHRLDYPRLRLIRGGETLPPLSYLDYLTDRRGARYARVRPDGLAHELANGAMLHLAAVDEAHQPISLLANNLAAHLKAKITVNICAGIRDSRGFATHWDGHDVLVMQIHGKKYWRVYGITQANPLRIGVGMDSAPVTDKPTTPTWEGLIEEGDILYLPRGCWHSAQGTDGPTLHLTVGIINPTGIDFLTWLASELLATDTFRMDLPELQSPEAKERHVAALRATLTAACNVEAVERFLASSHQKDAPRLSLNLPDI